MICPRHRHVELHVLTDEHVPSTQMLDVLSAAVEHGVDWVQVRGHHASARTLFRLAEATVALCRPLGVRVAVNDRLDVALTVRADGVQIGEDSLPLLEVRALVGAMKIGVSVHSIGEALLAEQEGADWVTFGHVFPTSSHPGDPPSGVRSVGAVVNAVRIPVIAIGGIEAARAAKLMATGVTGIAVVSAIVRAPDPGRATVELRRILDRNVTRHKPQGLNPSGAARDDHQGGAAPAGQRA